MTTNQSHISSKVSKQTKHRVWYAAVTLKGMYHRFKLVGETHCSCRTQKAFESKEKLPEF